MEGRSRRFQSDEQEPAGKGVAAAVEQCWVVAGSCQQARVLTQIPQQTSSPRWPPPEPGLTPPLIGVPPA